MRVFAYYKDNIALSKSSGYWSAQCYNRIDYLYLQNAPQFATLDVRQYKPNTHNRVTKIHILTLAEERTSIAGSVVRANTSCPGEVWSTCHDSMSRGTRLWGRPKSCISTSPRYWRFWCTSQYTGYHPTCRVGLRDSYIPPLYQCRGPSMPQRQGIAAKRWIYWSTC